MNEQAPPPIERIEVEGNLLALIVRSSFSESGLKFFTPDEFSQQLAYMRHPQGKVIAPHVHNEVKRTVHFTNEVLFIRKGRLRVDFYRNDKSYLISRILGPGDVVLLADGGHGFECLEELEMFEVKQGPYAAEMDKTRFQTIETNLVRYTAEEP